MNRHFLKFGFILSTLILVACEPASITTAAAPHSGTEKVESPSQAEKSDAKTLQAAPDSKSDKKVEPENVVENAVDIVKEAVNDVNQVVESTTGVVETVVETAETLVPQVPSIGSIAEVAVEVEEVITELVPIDLEQTVQQPKEKIDVVIVVDSATLETKSDDNQTVADGVAEFISEVEAINEVKVAIISEAKSDEIKLPKLSDTKGHIHVAIDEKISGEDVLALTAVSTCDADKSDIKGDASSLFFVSILLQIQKMKN